MRLTARKQHKAERAFKRFMSCFGIKFDSPATRRTPTRVTLAYAELCAHVLEPKPDFNVTTFENTTDQLVIVGPCAFSSLCEHHMLPYMGFAWVGYLPSKKILGLSKFPRLIRHFAARPSTQETLTEEITNEFEKLLKPRTIMVMMRAQHTCMSIRGAREPNAFTTTHAIRGIAHNQRGLKEEFLQLLEHSK